MFTRVIDKFEDQYLLYLNIVIGGKINLTWQILKCCHLLNTLLIFTQTDRFLQNIGVSVLSIYKQSDLDMSRSYHFITQEQTRLLI